MQRTGAYRKKWGKINSEFCLRIMIRISVLMLGALFFIAPWGAEAQPLCTVDRCTELGTCYINDNASRCAYESHGASSGALVFPHGTFFIERNSRNGVWGNKWSIIYGKRQEFKTKGANKLIGNWNYLSLDDGVKIRYPILPYQR